jgi:tRNA A37 N6-isopentenylltransferase MiaA
VLLSRDRAALYERIEARARAMLATGLLGEVERLLATGVPADCPAFESIGYTEFALVLRGAQKLDEALAGFVQRTRRYAKRQMTWFRNRYAGGAEVAIPGTEAPERTAERVLAALGAAPAGEPA